MDRQLPPGQQLVAPGKWPIIGERQPSESTRPWSLLISGLVAQPLRLSLEQLQSMPQSKQIIDIHCVTRWSKLQVEFAGVFLADLISMSKVDSSAEFVSFMSRSDRRHSTSLSLDKACSLRTLIALQANGAPLPESHGGPIRNIVPERYFYKSVKWLEEIELLEQDRLGYWEAESGYHNEADPWQEQRYMAPTLERKEAARLIATKDFSDRDLRGIDASHRDLEKLYAPRSLLRDANFSRSNLRAADFSNANLSNAHFRESDLRCVSFRDADLEGADFTNADLCGADLTGSSLIGASFFDPTSPEPSGAKFDKTTIIPESAILPLFPKQMEYVRRVVQMR